MTLLTKVLLINRTEIIFETVLKRIDFRPTTKFTPMTSFWHPNWTIFTKNDLFRLKMAYFFTKLNQLMTSLTTVVLIKLTKTTVETVLRKNIFLPPQNLDL